MLFFVFGEYMLCSFASQICPYNAVKFLPREQQITEDPSQQLKRFVGENLKKGGGGGGVIEKGDLPMSK